MQSAASEKAAAAQTSADDAVVQGAGAARLWAMCFRLVWGWEGECDGGRPV